VITFTPESTTKKGKGRLGMTDESMANDKTTTVQQGRQVLNDLLLKMSKFMFSSKDN